MPKLILLLSVFFITCLNVSAQISNPNVEKPTEGKKKKEKKAKKEKKEATTDLSQKATYYFTGAYLNSFRNFEDKTPYQSFAERNLETAIHTYGIGFGTFIPLAKNLDLEIGVSYVLQGEQFNYSDSLSDSTFHYTKRYRHFGVPLRFKYSFGKNNFKTFVYGGVIPSSILSYRYESDYTNKKGQTNDNNTVSKTNDLASFNVAVSAGFGLSYQLNNIGFLIIPEYRYNLLNTYDGTKVNHNLWSFGVNVGLTLKF